MPVQYAQKKKSLYKDIGKEKVALTWENEKELLKLCSEMAKEPPHDKNKQCITWIAVGYGGRGSVPGQMKILSKGYGKSISICYGTYGDPDPNDQEKAIEKKMDSDPNTAELQYKKLFTNDNVIFIIFRVFQVQYQNRKKYLKSPNMEFAKANYGFVFWQGKKADLVEKALGAHHFNGFSEMLREHKCMRKVRWTPGHYQSSDLDEIDPLDVRKNINLQHWH